MDTWNRSVLRAPNAPKETRQHAAIGAKIRWTLKAGQHMGRNRDEDIVREGTVVGYSRWYEGKATGALLMDCIEEPRKQPRERIDFVVPVSSDSWEVIEPVLEDITDTIGKFTNEELEGELD